VILALALSVGPAIAAEPPGIGAQLQPVANRAPAPAFVLDNGAGKNVALADFRGEVVLVDFWATECGGCVKEIPWFIEIGDVFKSAGLAVIGVSMDIAYEGLKDAKEGWAKVRPWVQAHKVGYPVVMGDDVAMKAYSIEALPVTYLVDRNGRIAAKYPGVVDRENLETNIRALLKE
jgi:peroxiredoxin